MTEQASTSMSSLPAVPLLPHLPCFSWYHFSGWTKRTGSRQSKVNPPHCPTQLDLLLTLLAASTAVCPQRETKTRPRLTGQSISPASESAYTVCHSLNTRHTLGQTAWQIIPNVCTSSLQCARCSKLTLLWLTAHLI